MTLYDLNNLCQEKDDGSWELLATAAGSKKSTTKSMNAINFDELQKGMFSDLLVSRSFVEDRIDSLSVLYRPYLKTLWEKIGGSSPSNEYVETAQIKLNYIFKPDISPTSTDSWEWSENINILLEKARELKSKPIKNTFLSFEELYPAAEYGGASLYSLIGQNVHIDKEVFYKFLQNPDVLEGWSLAALIELAYERGISKETWLDFFVSEIRKTDDPLFLTPSIYSLLSEDWKLVL